MQKMELLTYTTRGHWSGKPYSTCWREDLPNNFYDWNVILSETMITNLQEWMRRQVTRMNIESNMRTLKTSMILHMNTWMKTWRKMSIKMIRKTMENTNPMNATTKTLVFIRHKMTTMLCHKNMTETKTTVHQFLGISKNPINRVKVVRLPAQQKNQPTGLCLHLVGKIRNYHEYSRQWSKTFINYCEYVQPHEIKRRT